MLLQPTLIETQAAYAESRRVGRLEGKVCSASTISTCASCSHPGALQQHRQRADVVRAEDDVDPGRAPQDRVLVLLSQAAADGDLHARRPLLRRQQMTEAAVQPVVGVLPHRAGVEDDDVRHGAVGRRGIAGRLQQPGQPFGVVHVHLAAVGADLIRAGHGTGKAIRPVEAKIKCETVSIAPTGAQYEITSGPHRAVVTEVGRDVAELHRRRPGRGPRIRRARDVKGGRGQNLIPWPNRIRDGKYTFAGQTQQLALSEPARHNASHGLVRYVPWVLTDHQPDSVTNRVRIFPQPGWPGWLEATITYTVGGRRAHRHRAGDQHRRSRRSRSGTPHTPT